MKQFGYIALIAAMASLAVSLPASNSTAVTTGNRNQTTAETGKKSQPLADNEGFTVRLDSNPEEDKEIPAGPADSQNTEPTETASAAPASSSPVE